MKWQHVDGVYSEVTSSLADSHVFFIILQTRLQRALTIGKEEEELGQGQKLAMHCALKRTSPQTRTRSFIFPEGHFL